MTFKLIGASQIPQRINSQTDIVDPYVELILYSTEHPLKPLSLGKTSIVKDNGLNPTWNHLYEFQFKASEINILVIKVHDNDNTLLCWNALCLDVLCSKGTRAIEMRDANNIKTVLPYTSLIANILVED